MVDRCVCCFVEYGFFRFVRWGRDVVGIFGVEEGFGYFRGKGVVVYEG